VTARASLEGVNSEKLGLMIWERGYPHRWS